MTNLADVVVVGDPGHRTVHLLLQHLVERPVDALVVIRLVRVTVSGHQHLLLVYADPGCAAYKYHSKSCKSQIIRNYLNVWK